MTMVGDGKTFTRTTVNSNGDGNHISNPDLRMFCDESTNKKSSESIDVHFGKLSTKLVFLNITLEQEFPERFSPSYKLNKKKGSVSFSVDRISGRFRTILQGSFLWGINKEAKQILLRRLKIECACNGNLGVGCLDLELTGNQVKKVYTILTREGLLEKNQIRMIF